MKILKGLFITFLITSIRTVLSQITFNGTCEKYGKTEISSLTQDRYMGLWYIQGTYDYPDIKNSDCLTSVYTSTSNGYADILERSKNLNTNISNTINSKMVFDKFENGIYQGHYIYKIPSENVTDWPIDILATDYSHYSIEWSCLSNSNGTTSDCSIWVMSRKRYVDKTFYLPVDRILKRHNICKKSIRIVNQNETLCEYY